MIHMTPHDIIKALAESDPVYETSVMPPVPGTPSRLTKSFVRKCALCRAISGHNEENVRHEASCPWIPAKQLIAMREEIKPRKQDKEAQSGGFDGYGEPR